jgi:hypothetical protein
MNQLDWWTIVGTLASLIGLVVGLYVLSVAKDARSAAQGAQTEVLPKIRTIRTHPKP